MGKSPSDIDLIGLSKSIHMRSTEKKIGYDYENNDEDIYNYQSHGHLDRKITPRF